MLSIQQQQIHSGTTRTKRFLSKDTHPNNGLRAFILRHHQYQYQYQRTSHTRGIAPPSASTSFSESIDDDDTSLLSSLIPSPPSTRSTTPTTPTTFTDTPLASGARLLTDTFVSLNIIIFLLQIMFANELHLTELGVNVHAFVDQGEVWRLVTAMFLHGSVLHLVLNNLSLHALGSVTEWTCGRKRFVLLYVLSGIGGNLASYAMTSGDPTAEQIASLGASGAIFGLAGALIVYFARNQVLYRDKEVPSGMLLRLVGTVCANFALGSLLPNIDEAGHWGGLLSGIVLASILGPHYELARRAGHEDEIYLVDTSVMGGGKARLVYVEEDKARKQEDNGRKKG